VDKALRQNASTRLERLQTADEARQRVNATERIALAYLNKAAAPPAPRVEASLLSPLERIRCGLEVSRVPRLTIEADRDRVAIGRADEDRIQRASVRVGDAPECAWSVFRTWLRQVRHG
jgi:hypothetical protein